MSVQLRPRTFIFNDDCQVVPYVLLSDCRIIHGSDWTTAFEMWMKEHDCEKIEQPEHIPDDSISYWDYQEYVLSSIEMEEDSCAYMDED